MEYAVFALILCLVLILAFYNRRQAHALEYMARLEEDRTAREMQDRRERRAKDLQIEPMAWLESMVNPLLEIPIKLGGVAARTFPEVQAVELSAVDGRKLVISTQPISALRRYDRRTRRSKGKGAAARLTDFASAAILGNRWRVWNAPRTMADASEFFDIEAQACGKALGLDWGAPTRLWFYVLPA